MPMERPNDLAKVMVKGLVVLIAAACSITIDKKGRVSCYLLWAQYPIYDGCLCIYLRLTSIRYFRHHSPQMGPGPKKKKKWGILMI